jgi:hypothetical protein
LVAFFASFAGFLPAICISISLLARGRLFPAGPSKSRGRGRLAGPQAVWKSVGLRLLDDTCQQRAGRLEEGGCWPVFK